MDKNEKIGYHKGSLETLIKERSELVRLVSIVEALIKMHVKALKDEGVDVGKELKAKEGKEEDMNEHFVDFKKELKENK